MKQIGQSTLITLAIALAAPVGSVVLPRVNDGLARKPMMGWNSYNFYSCSPTEAIIHSNAQALVDLGLSALGYQYVTTDCGWSSNVRTANGSITWNPTAFPSGFPALGEFLHSKGLKFGVYADSGKFQCNPDPNVDQTGSLWHETQDAQSFADWGADMLKYDNCYSDVQANPNNPPDASYSPSVSPQPRYQTMRNALVATGRSIILAVCEWGVDFPAAWAPALAHSWRIGNDIIPAWRAIYRTMNQVVTQTSFAAPGQWPDLDMLYVGNGIFSEAEEQTQMSLWSMVKSPLTIGAPLKDPAHSISASSLAILKNADMIGINQDSLGIAASFRRRWTEEEYELWAGPLSGSRTVVAVVNWANYARALTVNFGDADIGAATSVRDVWQGKTYAGTRSSYTSTVAAHGTIFLILSGTSGTGTYTGSTKHKRSIGGTYYASTAAILTGAASLTTCSSSYCYPVGAKVGWLSPTSSATFRNVDGGSTGGTLFAYLDYIQNDVDFATTFTTGTNSRNMTFIVNGGAPQRVDLPLTGRSSELFGLKGWEDSSVFLMPLSGFVPGTGNTVEVGNTYGGTIDYAADFVGLRIMQE